MEVEKKLGMSLDALIGAAKERHGSGPRAMHPRPSGGTRDHPSGAYSGGGGSGGGGTSPYSRGGRGRGRALGQAGGQKRNRNESEAVVEIRVARRVFVNNLAYSTTWQHLKDFFSAAGNGANLTPHYPTNGTSPAMFVEGGKRRSDGGRYVQGCGIVEFERAEEAAAAITHLHLSQLDGREVLVREDREDYDLADTTGRGGGGGRGAGPASKSRRGSATASPSDSSGPECYSCGQVGHIARDCPNAERPGGSAVRGGGGGGGGCFECGTSGHYARDCPNKGNTSYGNSSGLQLVIHGLPYAMAWQELKDLLRTITATGGGNELRQVRTDVVKDASGRSRGYGTVLFESKEDAAAALEAISGHEHEGRVLTAKYDKLA